jgi:hypothetical protein
MAKTENAELQNYNAAAHLQQVVPVELQLEAAQVGILDHVGVQRVKRGLVVVLQAQGK